jgi:hypothetical protein
MLLHNSLLVTVHGKTSVRMLRGHKTIRHCKARKTAQAQSGVGRNRSTHADNHDGAAALSRTRYDNDHVPCSRPKELSCRCLPNHEEHCASETCAPIPLRCPSIHRIQHARVLNLPVPMGKRKIPQKVCSNTNPRSSTPEMNWHKL